MVSNRIDNLLDDVRHLSAERHAILTRLRAMALALGDDVTEEVKYGGLLFSAQTPFCGGFSYTRHVSLEFSEGAQLPDPHLVLEGSGKHRRHIKLLTVSDIDEKHVQTYIEAAYAIVGK